jgi:hypothetical protein
LAIADIDAVGELQRGVSLTHVRALLGPDPRHQFTSRVGGAEYVCVSYAFGKPHARFYFVFKDGKLEKITEPPPFRFQSVPFRGGQLEKTLPVDPEARVGEVMRAADLRGPALRASLAARLPRGSSSFMALSPFTSLAPQVAASEPRRAKEFSRNEQLAKDLDAGKVSLGDSRETVDAAFGVPLRTTEAGERIVCGYGAAEPLPMVPPAYLFSPVDVHFESGRAVSVFGNDFVNTIDGVRPKQ